ncbi:MAG: O-antigen ligase family protein [Nitrosomonas sp.]|nr:O-antigen ligase family protein [Nitrosomonas sp.]
MRINNFSLSTAALMAIGLIFLTNWPAYQYLVLGGPAPLVYFALTGLLVLLVVWRYPYTLLPLLREPLFYWFFIYAFTGLVWLVFHDGYLDPDNRVWRVRFLLMLLFICCLVLVFPANERKFVWVMLGCAVFAAASFWVDYLNPFLFVPQDNPGANPGRGSGLFINANQAGNALVAMCIAIMPFVSTRWRVIVMVVMLMGVFPTFSRSSTLFAVLVALIWVWRGQFGAKALVVLLVIMLPIGSWGGYNLFTTGLQSTEVPDENLATRLNFFAKLGETGDDSAAERKRVAEYATQKFYDNFLFGIGTGNAASSAKKWGYRVSTHNMFLLLLVEQGIFGGILYLSFLVYIFARGLFLIKSSDEQQGRDIGLALVLLAFYFSFIGLFSHTMLEEAVSILVLAFLLAVSRKMDKRNMIA